MGRKSILFISGSIGLGHVLRDLAIARELRRRFPEMELSWLAGEPASTILRDHMEAVLPEAEGYSSHTLQAESAAQGARLNLVRYAIRARKGLTHNVEVFERATRDNRFDLIIADEAYEIWFSLVNNPQLRRHPFVMIYDFVGLDAMTPNPVERLAVYYVNRTWAQDWTLLSNGNLAVYLGEPEDIPDRRFGFLLPNRREYAKTHYNCTGYALPFDPADLGAVDQLRQQLGYGGETLIVCTIGGTSIGRDLLELCARAYPLIRSAYPDLRMILVCGPRLETDSLDVPEGVEIRGYVPELYRHLAVCDLAIVQGGGTVTLELTALRRPFLYFPLEGHYEQQIAVAERLARHRAGVKMSYSGTTPESLAQTAMSHLQVEADWPPIPTDGVRRTAELIGQLL